MDKLYYLGKLIYSVTKDKKELTPIIQGELHIYQYFEVR